ncbi:MULTISPECIES: PLP-dependent aminotransferase family protein [unclassified Streptomyces]|uniref:aminotransferase-like domain-containing protein n=1 Tax=unclassified Streptomyces TaxID=2593676 RepID=UPI00225238A7|nr:MULTISPECIES: PLP-dependent aminotransferase family protein [unclassified Streptomyces]MCX4647824.1 PLP-dependent aminotransferase family protein [Streptomyces sp. NBC_01446]MCX5320402.1 PLP-dependent aminotransferase family protein [Streptomyces sp. NBC_00120]
MSPALTRVLPPQLAARAVTVTASPVREILALTARPEVISFAGGLPAPELFDTEGVSEAFRAVLDEQPKAALQYSTTEGDPGLRTAVAARVGARGLPTAPDDLVITTGSQQGLSLLASALIEPGDVVLVENPCYLAALQVFGFAGARVVPVPDLADLDDIVRRERPKLFYSVPNFQNPTGRTMSDAQRASVAEVAARRGMWIVEDDPYGELRYEGEATGWIASYPGAEDRTVLMGSFSKVMAPGLRIGWLRAPAELLRACAVAKQAADLHTPTVTQLAAARYLADRDLDAHIATVREAYGERRDAMLAALPDALPDGAEWSRPQGGMFLWARLPQGADATALLRTAIGHDVAYVPGAPFYAGEPDPATLRLCFVSETPEVIREGLGRLGGALRG